jgi:hypothetical protein
LAAGATLAREVLAGHNGTMRIPYVHLATVVMSVDDDAAAPGAAITLALCGSWEHSPPCPLAPHHTRPRRNGGAVDLRVVFATEPEHEDEVRRLIDAALAAGSATDPKGMTSRWTLRGSKPGVLSGSETARALRLARQEGPSR